MERAKGLEPSTFSLGSWSRLCSRRGHVRACGDTLSPSSTAADSAFWPPHILVCVPRSARLIPEARGTSMSLFPPSSDTSRGHVTGDDLCSQT